MHGLRSVTNMGAITMTVKYQPNQENMLLLSNLIVQNTFVAHAFSV